MFVDFGSMPQQSMTFQQQFQQLFQQGLADQQQKKCDDAISKYKNLLDQGRNAITNEQASVLYHNMGSCAFEKNDFVNAFIWTKKAMTLNSSNSFAHSLLAEINKKYQPPQIPHQISTVESLQKVGLKNVSFDILFIGFLLFLAISLAVALKLWIQRRKNQIESENNSSEKKQPVGAIVGFATLLTMTSLFLFLVMIKWSDLSIPKAIVVNNNSSVQTASGGNQAIIFEAAAGTEVDVLKTDENFAQIRYPGAFSGWVAKKNLEILSYPTWP